MKFVILSWRNILGKKYKKLLKFDFKIHFHEFSFFFSVNDIKSTLNKQVQRADIRLKSLNDMLELLKISDQLIPSIKFYLLSGWQGMVQHDQVDIQPAPQVLDQVYIIHVKYLKQ